MQQYLINMSYKIQQKATFLQKFFTIVLLTGLLITAKTTWSQNSISGTIHGYNNKTISLLMIRGDQKLAIDSVKTNSEGHFSIIPRWKLIPGMYLLKTTEGNSIRILYNNEDVRLVSGGVDDASVVDFVQSEENKLWYEYFILKSSTQYLQELLKPIMQQYPQNEPFYLQTKEEYNKLQVSLHEKANNIISSHPETMAARFIRTDLLPLIDTDLSFDEQRALLKKNFFVETDFSDTLLIQSDILSRKMIDFLSLHQRPNLSMPELQLEFIRGLDAILQLASVEKKMYLFVIEFFIEGFYQMGLTGVSDFLSTLPHLNSDCMDVETLMQIEQIVGPHRKIITGSAAPEIVSVDIHGNPFDLKKLESRKTILVFWSITCPHCLELLPELKQFGKENPEATIVSIIMSPNSSTLKSLIEQGELDWIHIADGKGWDSPIVESYMIYGTPTLFLLDADKKIQSKPSGMAELKAIFKLK
jgi:thiol-disulfide isomerase/thioredoxin